MFVIKKGDNEYYRGAKPGRVGWFTTIKDDAVEYAAEAEAHDALLALRASSGYKPSMNIRIEIK